jgi:hypothetical protein
MCDGAGSFHADVEGGEVKGRYAPMMTARTQFSLSLLDRFEPQAALLLGGPVLPVRAKGVRYVASTPWHTDSRHGVASVGFAAYLEPLDAESGALRVLPGSHRPDFGEAALTYVVSLGASATVSMLPGYAIGTEPGDVIAFDEHHASWQRRGNEPAAVEGRLCPRSGGFRRGGKSPIVFCKHLSARLGRRVRR